MCVYYPRCEDDILLRGASSAPFSPLASHMTHMQGPLAGEGHGRMSAEPLRLRVSEPARVCECKSLLTADVACSAYLVCALPLCACVCVASRVYDETQPTRTTALAWLIFSKGLESLILSETPNPL